MGTQILETIQQETEASHVATGNGNGHILGGPDVGHPGIQTAIADGGKRIISVNGTFVGTVKIQWSMNNSTYHDLITDVTTEKGYVITDPFKWIRSVCTAWTSGTINVDIQQMIYQG